MRNYLSKGFVAFTALVLASLIAAPANAKSKNHHKHVKHAAAHHTVKRHKAPKHA